MDASQFLHRWSEPFENSQAILHQVNGVLLSERVGDFFFFITLGLEMSDTKVYEP